MPSNTGYDSNRDVKISFTPPFRFLSVTVI